MVDANTFLLMMVYILCSILLVALIVLVVKLIATVNKLNGVMDRFNERLVKADRMFSVVDMLTDNMALVSDKIVDGLSGIIRRIFSKKKEREDEDNE